MGGVLGVRHSHNKRSLTYCPCEAYSIWELGAGRGVFLGALEVDALAVCLYVMRRRWKASRVSCT
jgi:hypothetical protein